MKLTSIYGPDWVWVYVGCGGTFYMAAPFLAVQEARRQGGVSVLVDPDCIEDGNEDRQWPGWVPGDAKVEAGRQALYLEEDRCAMVEKRFLDSDLAKYVGDRSVLAIVNVDNNPTRVEVRNWLSMRHASGALLLSGCEDTMGQAYWGLWDQGKAVHDCLDVHFDVLSEDVTSVDKCNLQTAIANQMTASCLAMAFLDLATCVEFLEQGLPVCPSEFHWASGGMWLETQKLTSLREVPDAD